MNVTLRVCFALCMLGSVRAELEFGDDAPSFRLYDQDGFAHSLSAHIGKYVLLFFYERDFTPFAIRGVKSFEKFYQELKEKNVVIYGVSSDFQYVHQGFHEKCHLTYDLLSDPEKEVIRLYGAKGWFGTKAIAILIGPDGRIFRKYDDGNIGCYPNLIMQDLN